MVTIILHIILCNAKNRTHDRDKTTQKKNRTHDRDKTTQNRTHDRDKTTQKRKMD